MIRPPTPTQPRTTQYSTLAYFPNRFSMMFIPKPDGKLYVFGSYLDAQKFIDTNQLGPNVSPVDITEDPQLDQMHVSHAVAEVLQRVNPPTS